MTNHISPFTSCLFYGPPGTGKTFLIEAFAAELIRRGFHFIQLQSADIHASHVGVAEKTVQIAFKEAVDNAPCCIYIDEFEDVSVKRKGDAQGYEKRLTTSLIEEYNSLKNAGKPIILLAATNHPINIDEAWMDRMESRERLPLPSEEARRLYFEAKLSKYPLGEGLTYDYMVDRTDNFSYRDLDNLSKALIAELVDLAKSRFSVHDETGAVDVSASDPAVSEAIENGRQQLARELFDTIRDRKPPSLKLDIMKELAEYEKLLQESNS